MWHLLLYNLDHHLQLQQRMEESQSLMASQDSVVDRLRLEVQSRQNELQQSKMVMCSRLKMATLKIDINVACENCEENKPEVGL